MKLIKLEDGEIRGQNAEQNDGQCNPKLQQCIKVYNTVLVRKVCDSVITALIGYY